LELDVKALGLDKKKNYIKRGVENQGKRWEQKE